MNRPVLEDEISDVIEKTMGGLGLSAEELADECGVSVCEISGLLHGDVEPEVVELVAPVLRLDVEALIGLKDYVPKPLDVVGVRRVVLPFHQWTVNAWVVEMGDVKLLFDAGTGERDVAEAVDVEKLTAAFVTHDHQDHVGGVGALKEAGVRVISEREAMAEGEFSFDGISIRVVDLSGHKEPSAGYFLEGLGRRVLVAGDAIFAGSMGKWWSCEGYELAFETLVPVLREAGDDCVLLPGHGPATTVGEEMRRNPFRVRF